MQVGELLQRAGGFLTRTSCSSPGGSTSSCRSYSAERPPGLLPKKGETHFHPGPSWTRAPTSTVPRIPVRTQFGAMTSWKFHRAARARTSNGPWDPALSWTRKGRFVSAPPHPPPHLAPVKTRPGRTSYIASQRSPGGRIFPAQACKAHNLARAAHNSKWKIPERRFTGSAGGNISVFPEFFGEFTQTGEDLLLILCRVLFENGLGRPTKTIGHLLDLGELILGQLDENFPAVGLAAYPTGVTGPFQPIDDGGHGAGGEPGQFGQLPCGQRLARTDRQVEALVIGDRQPQVFGDLGVEQDRGDTEFSSHLGDAPTFGGGVGSCRGRAPLCIG